MAEVFAVFGILLAVLIALLIAAAFYVLTSFIYKGMFDKAGIRGMLGFVPFYRDWLLIETCEMPWYWFVAKFAPILLGTICAMIPFVGSLASSLLVIVAKLADVAISYNLNKKFKGSDAFLILLALLPIVGMGIFAFSKNYSFHKDVKVNPDGFFGDFGFINNPQQHTDYEVKTENIKNDEEKFTKEEINEVKEEAKDAEVEEEKTKSKKKKTKKEED